MHDKIAHVPVQMEAIGSTTPQIGSSASPCMSADTLYWRGAADTVRPLAQHSWGHATH
jgi:hypothetical protein